MTTRSHPKPRTLVRQLFAAGLLGGLLVAALPPAQAQSSNATVRGTITAAGASAPAGTEVLAVNKANGNTYRTKTLADGSYVLPGLQPGNYEIRVGGASQGSLVSLSVGESATLDLTSGTDQLSTVVVSGNAQRQGARDTQVSTLVSNKMIENLPQATRNFLSAVDLAPGAQFETASDGSTHIRGGAQNQDSVNLFIDGVGRKNNILRGGVIGQQSSQGNPFPQGAIGEYRVLTQNYKAEYDQVTSLAVTALTKSGTNEFHGEVYANRTGSNWQAKDPIEKKNEAAGIPRPSFSQVEEGFSLGGPIIQDKLHFFLAYDGKSIDRPIQVTGRNFDKFPGSPGIIPQLKDELGQYTRKFKEDLLFGKLSAQINDEQKLDVSFTVRDEHANDLLGTDGVSAASTAKDTRTTESRLDIAHEWSRGPWLNEAKMGFDNSRFNPHSVTGQTLFRYKYSPPTSNKLTDSQDVIWVGGSPDEQDRKQDEIYFKDDLTYTGLNGHVIKGGAQLKLMKYRLGGTQYGSAAVDTLINPTTGQPYYVDGACTGTTIDPTGLSSDQCKITTAVKPVDVNFNNKQYGIYLQDDWSVTRKLELSLGARWDYEDNMLNNSYVTPASVVAALLGPDTRGSVAGIPVPAGQTYAQSIAKGGVDISEYIANGNARKAYKGALAPRLGFSYDTTDDRSTVIYGGWGRSYDRTMANEALQELQHNAQFNIDPKSSDIYLIKNNYKMPFADQISLGVRQALGEWNADIAVTQQHAKNQFIWFSGNRDPNGGYGTASIIDPLFGNPAGPGHNLVLGDTVGQIKTTSLFVKIEKPYTVASGWSATVAYTHAEGKTTNKDWGEDDFDWTYGKGTHGWNPSLLLAQDRLVVAGFTDRLPWGLGLSGKWTFDTGNPHKVTDCSQGFDKCVYRKADSGNFSQFDLGMSKDFKLGIGALRLRADVLNLFNRANWNAYDDWVGGPGNPQNALGGDNANFGSKLGVRGDMRTYKLTASYSF
ncbi:TonB-dependent receptor [Paucibacter sp. R3-3]|uniref:TonB-dependent receptor n=1 Tax=Roseateles agri TaxID=3098619 RepID=A0ABU5DME8_9BURK|nr:TonB-dependent receptor [Paucibacter sp. R3-3]MDY0746262.1 TonB-dependent receptor [Paucibacter sp. R3-3]